MGVYKLKVIIIPETRAPRTPNIIDQMKMFYETFISFFLIHYIYYVVFHVTISATVNKLKLCGCISVCVVFGLLAAECYRVLMTAYRAGLPCVPRH